MGIALVLALPVCAAAAPALAVTDDFADNDNTPRWLIVEDNPTAQSIAETHGRVEMTAHGTAALSNDALFLSDRSQGFALSTAGDFNLTAGTEVPEPGALAVVGLGLLAIISSRR